MTFNRGTVTWLRLSACPSSVIAGPAGPCQLGGGHCARWPRSLAPDLQTRLARLARLAGSGLQPAGGALLWTPGPGHPQARPWLSRAPLGVGEGPEATRAAGCQRLLLSFGPRLRSNPEPSPGTGGSPARGSLRQGSGASISQSSTPGGPPGLLLLTWPYLASCSRAPFSSPFTACGAAAGKLLRPRLLHSSTLGLW